MRTRAPRSNALEELLAPLDVDTFLRDYWGQKAVCIRGGRAKLDKLVPGGFGRAVQDLIQLVVFEKAEDPGLPVFLFGHSMGSFFVQAFMIDAGSTVALTAE